VSYASDGVDIEVVNDRSTSAVNGSNGLRRDGGGHGLVGMRERAQMFGGTLQAGRVRDGFRVRAHLPTNRVHS
jgi:signal transduction histidine kinase